MNSLPDGVRYLPNYLNPRQQNHLVTTIRDVVQKAPLCTPAMPKTGKPMSVRMSNCGKLGWVTDKQSGYRYQEFHPITQNQWPDIPAELLEVWHELANYPHLPEACLINYYNEHAKMGLHQDRDEQEFDAPVISISLGDDCLFRVGGDRPGGPTKSIRLQSGDVIVLEGAARLAFHGVDKIYSGTSMLLKTAGRINLGNYIPKSQTLLHGSSYTILSGCKSHVANSSGEGFEPSEFVRSIVASSSALLGW